MPAVNPLAQSRVFGELLAYEVDETASSSGDATGLSFEDTLDGFICGETMGDGSAEVSLGVFPFAFAFAFPLLL